MGHRLSKIYTRTGDAGSTGLGDGSRMDKDCARAEALGAVDELNSLIGLLLTESGLDQRLGSELTEIQHDLFDLGGELAMPGHQFIPIEYVTRLEQQLDHWNAGLPPLKEFILPGGNRRAALCHHARTVCRRAERRLVSLAREDDSNPILRAYLNRLSDYLFVVARVLARQGGGSEVLWNRSR